MTERRRLSDENKAIALRLFDEVLNALSLARCDACLTFYAYPEAHWPNIRTSNIIERMFEEVGTAQQEDGGGLPQ